MLPSLKRNPRSSCESCYTDVFAEMKELIDRAGPATAVSGGPFRGEIGAVVVANRRGEVYACPEYSNLIARGMRWTVVVPQRSAER